MLEARPYLHFLHTSHKTRKLLEELGKCRNVPSKGEGGIKKRNEKWKLKMFAIFKHCMTAHFNTNLWAVICLNSKRLKPHTLYNSAKHDCWSLAK